ncbi:hypothetical protein [Streptomyces sp. NPDC004726]
MRIILLAFAAVIAIQLAISAVRTVTRTGRAVVAFSRTQIENKFWRDSGKLATFVSFALLAIAYGLYGQDQSKPLPDALKSLGKEWLTQVIPLAIVTQMVLLCGFWIMFGLLARVPARTLLEPFQILLGFVVGMALAVAVSVGVLRLTDGNAENALLFAGVTMMATCGYIMVMVKVSANQPTSRQSAVLPLVLALSGLALLFTLLGSVLTAVYLATTGTPSVQGLLGVGFTVLSVVVILSCYGFRGYLDNTTVPPAVPYLIDFSLAVSACAIALARSTEAQVTLGGLPPWVVVVGPPLIIAAVILLVNLRQHLPSTANWQICLAAAFVVGLLAGPAQQLLAAQLLPVVQLLPLPQL